MLRRYWRTILKVGGFIGLAIAGYLVATALLEHSDQLEQRAANYSDEYTQNAEYRIKNVCPSAISEPDCVDQANEAAREGQRKEQDLAAQNVTAWWTKVMGFAALIGMVLSAVGVWLVKTTFEETRKSNKIALQAATHEFGPDLKITKARFEMNTEQATLTLDFLNSGRGAASDIKIHGRLTAVNDWIYEKHRKTVVLKAHSAHIDFLDSNQSNSKGGRYTEHVFFSRHFNSETQTFSEIFDYLENGPYPRIGIEIFVTWATPFGEKSTIRAYVPVFDLQHRATVADGKIKVSVSSVYQKSIYLQ